MIGTAHRVPIGAAPAELKSEAAPTRLSLTVHDAIEA